MKPTQKKMAVKTLERPTGTVTPESCGVQLCGLDGCLAVWCPFDACLADACLVDVGPCI